MLYLTTLFGTADQLAYSGTSSQNILSGFQYFLIYFNMGRLIKYFVTTPEAQ